MSGPPTATLCSLPARRPSSRLSALSSRARTRRPRSWPRSVLCSTHAYIYIAHTHIYIFPMYVAISRTGSQTEMWLEQTEMYVCDVLLTTRRGLCQGLGQPRARRPPLSPHGHRMGWCVYLLALYESCSALTACEPLSCPALSCPVLSCPLPCPALPYPVLL